MTQQSTRWNWIPLAAVVSLFAGFIIVLWQIDLFDFTGTDPSAKIVAASLALVGGLIAALVSVVGLLLRHSLDQRNADLKREAEDRLKLEAAIQAVQLLSTSSGEPVPMAQRAGALFALASLGQYELTTTLTGQLLGAGTLDSSSAAWLLDQSLCRGTLGAQHDAIMVLLHNVKHMINPNRLDFPRCIWNWNLDLPDFVREWIPTILGNALVASPLAEWKRAEIRSIVGVLVLGWTSESPGPFRNNIGAVLNSVVQLCPNVGELIHPKTRLHMIPIRSEIAGLSPSDTTTANTVNSLDAWVVERQPDGTEEAAS